MSDENRTRPRRVDRKKWDALQTGDRVQAVYREGKYTGTVWASENK